MLRIEMTEENLRKIAEDALKRGEYGVVIWQTETHWRNLRESFSVDSEIFSVIAEKIQNGKAMWFNIERHDYEEMRSKTRNDDDYMTVEWVGFCELAVSAKRLVEDEEYLNWIRRVCQYYPLKGPVTTVPSMHLSSAHFNLAITKG